MSMENEEVVKCSKCGHVDSYTYDLLYHDMESMLMQQSILLHELSEEWKEPHDRG